MCPPLDRFHCCPTLGNYSIIPLQVVDKSLLGLVHGICTHCRRSIDLRIDLLRVRTFPMYQPKEGFIYYVSWQLRINYCLLKSVSTSSLLSWYMGNVHRSVPLMLPSTRIHVIFNHDKYISVTVNVQSSS